MPQPGAAGPSRASQLADGGGATTSKPSGPEKIPQLTNVAPSVFIPFNDDVTKDTEDGPRDRMQRLRRILESVDYQRDGVKENLLFLFQREKTRIMQESLAQELKSGQGEYKPALKPREVDWVVGNMAAKAQPGFDYNIKQMPYPEQSRPVLPPSATIRDKATANMLHLVEAGIQELTGYDAHMGEIRRYYIGCLDKELERLEVVGMRPEERPQRVAQAQM
ncbi:hypothetical protein B0T26DRAFT_460458 [Lasiosphaeria miniovina]|uniref:Uncharacterized protein n=1 Tax=Lasiosphaeria miniovina TaxID=1954250 RepID=A0AA40DMR5_9PEZI|nr:uncharacterized protein B0T26DRAFT_460458 [Lasiosphaeria miniovina]KAK0706552.1 hypothetical protein B0T26DRAFT_460458 [Lasiosphaeria miniovina]